jgi:hypothetical protein
MKADLRISIKDYSRNKNLKVQLVRLPFGYRQFYVQMNGQPWPSSGKPASLTKIMAASSKDFGQSSNDSTANHTDFVELPMGLGLIRVIRG